MARKRLAPDDRAESLTRFAVETRYPGMSGPVTEAKYRGTIRRAEAVLGWAGRHIGPP